MSAIVSVREYARLTTAAVAPGRLDCAQISESAFEWLCELSASFNRNGATLLQIEGRSTLKWDSYVGMLETPCGTRLEILPKHHEQDDCLVKSRRLLRRMIQHALHLKPRETSVASLDLFDAPLSEWVMGQFLAELDLLVKRGVRFDYRRIEEEQRFLRGQLNVVAQMRQPPGRQHHFQIRHDIFLPDRAENRLLKLALEQVAKKTQQPANWRLANELRAMLAELPVSRQVSQDFGAWSGDRLMAHYQAIKPWCELILNQQMPIAVSGEWRGISLLFPMEKLFENYVEGWLRRRLAPTARLTSQAARHSLCVHDGSAMFRLEPDLLLEQGERAWVLDTKWKRLDGGDRRNKYGLSQADFYQLFSYGHRYLGGSGELALIYPRTAQFSEPLPAFEFSSEMRLWVLPFDVEGDELLVGGEEGFGRCFTGVI
ncbi:MULTISPECIES: McrC family protein [Pseudomonas]|uniref:McrC family protein n=1 Tax=Pseudomonas TaxID=286 RepID=UPI00029CFC18|nr:MULTISPECIES: McrC family protein [Pseudomonas]AFY17846.1 McrBC 5-methylcytosine restriction system component-like protein [Pseudomonas sp. UW4]MDF9776685.1 5-methylcytosine-specific restriction enzyme subunit McrC [Pseudomonas baetica]